MRHHNSVLHGLLKHLPRGEFERLVDEHEADALSRTLNCRTHLVALLYAQLSGSVSLREIEAGMQSHAARLYHLGARQVSRSTLSDANRARPHAVFSGLFSAMSGLIAGARPRREVGEVVRLIDSTSLRLNALTGDWSRFSTGVPRSVHGAKAHVVYDPDEERPVYLQISASKLNDIKAAQAMPIEAGATYVFDLGYYDFAWWAKLDAAGCRLVSRLKTHTKLATVRDLATPEDRPDIVSDKIGHLPARQAKSRQNPFGDPVRLVEVQIDPKRTLRIVCNDLDAGAAEIADLYKRRWQIELFFRWIKQTLKIKHFYGRSENAVRIQIAVAFIAYLLIYAAHRTSKSIQNLQAFARTLRTTLLHRRRLDQLLSIPTPFSHNPRQLCLELTQA